MSWRTSSGPSIANWRWISDRAGNVAHAPESFEERLQPYGPTDFQTLRVFLPERHDLAIMKVARGYFVGADRVRLNFLAMVEQLLGETASDRVARKL